MENKKNIRNCRTKYFSPNMSFHEFAITDIMTTSDSDVIFDTWENISTGQSSMQLLD